MDPVPLLPKSSLLPLPDISCTIRKYFQELYERDVPPEHFADNLKVSTVHSEPRTRKHVADLVDIYNEHKKQLVGISDVENRMMRIHAKHMHREEEFNSDELLREVLKLKRQPQFRDLEEEIVKKYHLLQYRDLLPSKQEQEIDFLAKETQMLKMKRETSDTNLYDWITRANHVNLAGLEITKTLYQNDKCSGKSRWKSRAIQQTTVEPMTKTNRQLLEKVNFSIKPRHVLFTDYEVNELYSKVVRVKNMGSIPTKCRVVPLLLTSTFTVDILPSEEGTKFLSPGCFFNIKIEFVPDTLSDHHDTLKILVSGEDNIEIPLTAGRKRPKLILYMDPLLHIVGNNPPTINFGSCMIGNDISFNLSLHNVGGKGAFCLFSEEEWNSKAPQYLLPRNELKTSLFTISPVCFEMTEGQVETMNISFHPEIYGENNINIIIVCDNCCMKAIRLTGTGISYDDNFITFLDVEKTFPFDIGDDFECDFYLDLGQILSGGYAEKKILILNNACLPLLYHWEKRKASVSFYDSLQFDDLPDDLLEITPPCGQFEPNSGVEFTVSCCMNSASYGRFRIVLCLYLDKISGKAFTDHPCTTHSVSIDSQFYNILSKNIEIWTQFVPFTIYLDPCQIDIKGYVPCSTSRYVKICNETNTAQMYRWKPVKTNDYRIKIRPKYGEIPARDSEFYQVNISGNLPQVIDSTVNCHILNTPKLLQLGVKFEIDEPNLAMNSDIINFGIVKVSAKHVEKVQTRNISEIPVQWDLTEVAVDSNTKSIFNAWDSLLDPLTLHLPVPDDVNDVSIELNTGSDKLVSSFVLATESRSQSTESILVIGDVQYGHLHLSTPLIHAKNQYIGVQSQHTVTLVNQTQLRTGFEWGNAVGVHKEHLDISIYPTKGVIGGRQSADIMVTIVPKFSLDVQEFYIPCFLEGIEDPIFLSIHCEMKSLKVSFHFPETKTVFYHEAQSCKSIFAPEAFLLEDIFTNRFSDESIKDLPPELSRMDLETSSDPQESLNVSDEPSTRVSVNESDDAISLSEVDNFLTSDDNKAVTFLRLKDKLFEPEIISGISDDKVHIKYEYMCLNFGVVSVNKCIKKRFVIRNETPISTNFTLALKNFYGKQIDQLDPVDDVYVKVCGQARDTVAARMLEGKEAVFCLHPESSSLSPYETVEIEVSFFADTWGMYVDEITCTMGHGPTYFIALVADVVGCPVNFYFFRNPNGYPVLRFNPLPFKGPSVTRSLKIVNSSSIGVMISWHCFLKDDSHGTDLPFNAVLHTSDETLESEPRMEVFLSPFYGFQSSEVFEVNPLSSFLEAKGESIIHVTCNPTELQMEEEVSKFKGTLVGFIYISEKYKTIAPKSFRKDGCNAQPLILHLTSVIENVVDVCGSATDLMQNELIFNFSATDVLHSQAKKATATRVFKVKNRNRTETRLHLSTSKPFKIKRVETNYENSTAHSVRLPADSHGSVTLEATLTKEDFAGALEVMKSRTSSKSMTFEVNERRKGVTWKKDLIMQQGNLTQSLPLTATLLFPVFNVSTTHINFGYVFLNTIKHSIVTVYNKSEVLAECSACLCKGDPAFQIEPKACSLQPASRSVQFQQLTITFAPTEAKHYDEIVLIQGHFPGDSYEITIAGEGTWNSKYFIPGR